MEEIRAQTPRTKHELGIVAVKRLRQEDHELRPIKQDSLPNKHIEVKF